MITANHIRILCMGLLLGFFARNPIQAQHAPQYGQYMFNGLAINPAYAGSKGALYATLLTRAQWTGFAGAPRTANLSLHTTSRNLVNNFGVLALHDRLGAYQQTAIQGMYAYRINWDRASLSFGLQGGFSNFQIAYDRLAKEEDFDPVFAENPNLLIPKFGTGIYFNLEKFYLGVSVPEMLQVRSTRYRQFFGESNQFRNYFFTGGFLVNLSRDVKVKPSILVKHLADVPVQADLNVNFIFKDKLWLGASYRTKDAMMGLVELQVLDQLRIGYAYDWSISQLRRYNNGSHELAISYRFGYKVNSPGILYF